MPSATFHNLPQAKREKILQAIRAEFSRVPFDTVSINKIIQAADISRGSFYQYFQDKLDVMRYLLHDYVQQTGAFATQSLQKSGGNLFTMYIDLFDFTVAFVQGENNAFFRNLLSDARILTRLFERSARHEQARAAQLQQIRALIDTSTLDVRTQDDLEQMVCILQPVMVIAIAEAVFDPCALPVVRSRFLARIELLKRGFLKDEETVAC